MVCDARQLPLIFLGLAFILGFPVGSTEAKALKGEQDISNCLADFCPTLYLYNTDNDQVEYEGRFNKMQQMEVSWALVQGEGCFVLYKQENFEGPSVKVDSSNSVTFKEWNTVKSIEYLPSAEKCNPNESTSDPNAGTSVFASLEIIVLLLFASFLGHP